MLEKQIEVDINREGRTLCERTIAEIGSMAESEQLQKLQRTGGCGEPSSPKTKRDSTEEEY